MKKVLLSILSLTSVAALNAQVTITSADFPSAGSSVILVQDSMAAGVSIGASGAAQTWDLTQISQHGLDTLDFIAASASANAASFPTSDIALDGGVQETFFTNNATMASVDGFAGDPFGLGVAFTVPNVPVEQLMSYPAMMGTSFSDTAGFRLTVDAAQFNLPVDIDSFRVVRNVYTVSTMDGDGTVTTPGGTYSAVREYKVQESIDSIFVYISDAFTAVGLGVNANQWELVPINAFTQAYFDENPVLDTTFTYTWFANAEGYHVAQVETDENDNPISAEYKYNNNMLVFVDSQGQASCAASCDGSGTVSAIGGSSNYTYVWPNGATTASASGLCSGANNVTISDGINTSIATVNVSEAPAWTSSINAFEHASCGTCADGSATAVAAGGTAPYTYMWNDAASQTTAIATGLLPGAYNCTITDVNGCSSITSIANVTSIFDQSFRTMVKVYPNPTKGKVVIETKKMKSITIYNTVGEILTTFNVNSDNQEIDLSAYNNGVYFVQIETEDNVVRKKITLTK